MLKIQLLSADIEAAAYYNRGIALMGNGDLDPAWTFHI